MFTRALQTTSDNRLSFYRNMFTIINIIDSYRKGIVEQHEEERKLRCRQLVIRFCRSVLNGQNKQICGIIDEHDFSPLDIAGMKLTRDTFGDSFKRVCEELFRTRPSHTAYIIFALLFALYLHMH